MNSKKATTAITRDSRPGYEEAFWRLGCDAALLALAFLVGWPVVTAVTGLV